MSLLDSLEKVIRSVVSDFTVPPEIPRDANPDILLSAEAATEPIIVTKDAVRVYAGTPVGRQIANEIQEHSQELMDKGERDIELDFRDSINMTRSLPADPREVKRYDGLFERFKKFAPRRDWSVIEEALYVRRLFEGGHNVAWYAETITIQYGSRGSNISKLISSKYFEDYIEPMYQHMGDTDEFYEFYEEAVTQFPFAVFVSKRRDERDVKSEILRKIAQNLDNNGPTSTHVINIHGIGHANGKTISRVLADSELEKFYTSEPDIVDLDSGTYARIFF